LRFISIVVGRASLDVGEALFDGEVAMDEEVITKRNPGRPKKKEDGTPFVGFTMGHIQNTYFSMPAIWIDVCAEIDNLDSRH
jgi:hypothetical protein